MKVWIRILALTGLASLAGIALAEKKPIHIPKDVSLTVEVILDSTVREGGAQLVLNPSMIEPVPGLEALPDYCLLNAEARIEAGEFVLIPGAMVCVSDDIRILEAVVIGRLEGLPECNDCNSVSLMSGDRFELRLDQDLELMLQVRADGQDQ